MIEQVKELIRSIRPVKTKFDLIRVGGNEDGGYLVPDDLKGINICFSPGVDVTATFEKDLVSRGIMSHLADASVSNAPDDLKALSFTKKYLGAVDQDDFMTLERWVKKEAPLLGDLILQMDIEGAEYTTIIATPTDILKRFRIIVIEVHDVSQWFSPIAWNTVQMFFAKLTQDFFVVHNHPNNNGGSVTVGDEQLAMPNVFELTLLRKDRSKIMGFVDELPHPLDKPNLPKLQDISLPEWWYK